jgi:hypothetical protein
MGALMTKTKYQLARGISLLVFTVGISIGLIGDPVAASPKLSTYQTAGSLAQSRLLPGDYVRWTWTLTVSRSNDVKRFVNRYENASQAAVVGASGVLCAALSAPAGPEASVIVGGTCLLIVTVYWGAFKDAVKHLSNTKPRLRIQERCNMFLPFGVGCRLHFDPVVK